MRTMRTMETARTRGKTRTRTTMATTTRIHPQVFEERAQRRKIVTSEREICLQKSAEIFYMLISRFEWLFLLNTVTKVIYHTSLLIDCVILLLVSRCTTPGT